MTEDQGRSGDAVTGTVPAATVLPGAYGRLLRRLEGAHAFDGIIQTIEPVARRLVASGRIRRVLHGDATGVPLHVILTDVPFGAWFMALFLDLFRDAGSRRAATRLVALGVVGAAPTAVSGWAEWALADRATQRVGVIHAALNALAILIFLSSWVTRVRQRHQLGVGLGRLGALVLVAGGFLGGYLDKRLYG